MAAKAVSLAKSLKVSCTKGQNPKCNDTLVFGFFNLIKWNAVLNQGLQSSMLMFIKAIHLLRVPKSGELPLASSNDFGHCLFQAKWTSFKTGQGTTVKSEKHHLNRGSIEESKIDYLQLFLLFRLVASAELFAFNYVQ